MSAKIVTRLNSIGQVFAQLKHLLRSALPRRARRMRELPQNSSCRSYCHHASVSLLRELRLASITAVTPSMKA